jgi:hypothetical protein
MSSGRDVGLKRPNLRPKPVNVQCRWYDMAGVWDLKGWQWMFILEGLPTTLLGLFIFFYLDDKPQDAKWLSANEKGLIRHNLELEQVGAGSGGHDLHSFLGALKDPKVHISAKAPRRFGSNRPPFR